MINAVISNTILSFTEDNLYIGFSFQYIDKSGDKPEVKTVSTKPIYLVNSGESWGNSAAAGILATIFDMLGASEWSKIKGMNAQIDIDNEGNIIKIANIYDEDKFITLTTINPEKGVKDVEEVEVEEVSE